MPKVYIKTFGCQMNTRDAEVIAGILQQAGFGAADSAELADVVIFVTCSVRQHAEDKVWSEIGRICKRRTSHTKIKNIAGSRKAGKDEGRKTIIGLVGCMAQEHREKAFERSPDVDFVVGPQDIGKIPSIVKELSAMRYPLYAKKIWETHGQVRPEGIYHTGFYYEKDHAFVVISEGCSNFCSYCVVPYVRGPLRHRDFEDVLQEVEQAVGSGRRRITLLGQNVCAYGLRDREQKKGRVSFIDLLILVNGVKGLEELSFITSHPKDTTVELFEAMQWLDKLKKYLHLPVQSGSDRILKLMNRGYSRKYYLDLVDNYRRIVSNGVLTTDVIVGFPGETESDFEDTVDLVKRVEFDSGFIFKYSPRPFTSALNFVDDVAKDEKERRHAVILELQRGISKEIKKSKFKI
ncbi:MAG: tRNA (N6-isopentenyl adenosine(37)-C2)-methylthiotransferase MiaB [Candidatus Omnitrophota bacterium]